MFQEAQNTCGGWARDLKESLSLLDATILDVPEDATETRLGRQRAAHKQSAVHPFASIRKHTHNSGLSLVIFGPIHVHTD